MPRKPLKVNLEVHYIPCPEEKVEAWRASMLLLLQLIFPEHFIPRLKDQI